MTLFLLTLSACSSGTAPDDDTTATPPSATVDRANSKTVDRADPCPAHGRSGQRGEHQRPGNASFPRREAGVPSPGSGAGGGTDLAAWLFDRHDLR